jgi:hypothetical protein
MIAGRVPDPIPCDPLRRLVDSPPLLRREYPIVSQRAWSAIMAIELTCACGKVLQVVDHAAGTMGQCPACGRLVPMPAADGESSQAVIAVPNRLTRPAPRADTAVAEGSPPEAAPTPAQPAAPGEWGEIVRPPYKLWSPGLIGLVAFLGGPVGPLLMMAINYDRMGKRAAAWTTAMCFVLTAGVIIVLANTLPDNTPSAVVISVSSFIAIYIAARRLQGEPYEAHMRAGGPTASGWSAAGMGVLGIALFLGAFVAAAFAFDLGGFGTRVDFGGGQEIYYARGATEADARALGQVLRQAGFFDGRSPAAVRVACEGDRMIVSFILQP